MARRFNESVAAEKPKPWVPKTPPTESSLLTDELKQLKVVVQPLSRQLVVGGAAVAAARPQGSTDPRVKVALLESKVQAKKEAKLCRNAVAGKPCLYGPDCKFVHPITVNVVSKESCFKFRDGHCPFGVGCRFSHDGVPQGHSAQ